MNRSKLKPPRPPEGWVSDGLLGGGGVRPSRTPRGAAVGALAPGCWGRPLGAAAFPPVAPARPLAAARLLPELLGVAALPAPPVPPRGPPVGADRVAAGRADSRTSPNSKKFIPSPPCDASVPSSIRNPPWSEYRRAGKHSSVRYHTQAPLRSIAGRRASEARSLLGGAVSPSAAFLYPDGSRAPAA